MFIIIRVTGVIFRKINAKLHSWPSLHRQCDEILVVSTSI